MEKVKHPKREDLLKHTYKMLYTYWPEIMKKLGLYIDAFAIPKIKFCKGNSHVDPEFVDMINLNYNLVLKSYKNHYKEFQGLKVPYRSLCLEDIIHESVHYIQTNFYDISKDEPNCSTEGVATIVAFDILLKDGQYNNPVTKIADMFYKVKKEYNDCFKLPSKYNKHIEEVLQDKSYKPKSFKEYAAGFVYICKYYLPTKGNFLELLIEPFSKEECYKDLGLN